MCLEVADLPRRQPRVAKRRAEQRLLSSAVRRRDRCSARPDSPPSRATPREHDPAATASRSRFKTTIPQPSPRT
jgi:hypothetical protein